MAYQQQPRGLEAFTPATVEARLHGDLAHDTGGQLTARFEYAACPVGELACGSFVMEPVLGAVAVDRISHREPFTYIRWTDRGPCTATVRYAASACLQVRGPALTDRLLAQRGIDQAIYKGRAITADTARLIAAHLHYGPRSALYRFAINGALPEHLLVELNARSAHGQQYLRGWAKALLRYCLTRDSPGPLHGWAPPPKMLVESPVPAGRPMARKRVGRPVQQAPPGGLLTRKYVRSELALQLLDAAFALGMAACRSDGLAKALRAFPNQRRSITRSGLCSDE